MRTDYAVHTRIKADDMASPVMKRIMNQAKLTARSFRGLNAAARGLRSVGNLARPLERGLRTLGFAGIAAGGAALAMANNYATARDEQAKFSRQIGFSADSLDRLKFIADRQGASFDTLRSGLTAFTKRVGELRAGTGSLNAILKKTDPAFASLLKNTTDNQEAFELFLAKVASLPDEQAKAALAAAGVSRGAMESIIRLTDGGTDAFKALRDEADKFRAPITDRDLRNAEAYKDAQTNVNFAIRGVVDTIGSRFLPLMTPVLTRLADWVAANRELIGTKLDEYSDKIAAALDRIDFDRIATKAGEWVEKAGVVIKRGGEIVESLGGIEGVIGKVFKAWLIFKGLSLASLVLTVGGQAIAIGSAIAGIATSSALAKVGVVSDFDTIQKRHSRLAAALGKGIVFGGIVGVAGAVGISELNKRIDARADEIEAGGIEREAAREKAKKEVTSKASDAILRGIVKATDSLGAFRITDERLRARVGAPPIAADLERRSALDIPPPVINVSPTPVTVLPAPMPPVNVSPPTVNVLPTPVKVVAPEPRERGLGGAASLIQLIRNAGGTERPTLATPRRPATDKIEVEVTSKVESDDSLRVKPTGVTVRRRGNLVQNVGATMIEQN